MKKPSCPFVRRAFLPIVLSTMAIGLTTDCVGLTSSNDLYASPPPKAEPAKPAAETPVPQLEGLMDGHGWAMRARSFGGRGPAFAPSVTRRAWQELPQEARNCSQALLTAQAAASRRYALRAVPTFRNCMIDQGRDYIRGRLERFQRAVDDGKMADATEALGEAVASLHAFYAYSNYVELLHDKGGDIDDHLLAPTNVWSKSPLPVLKARLSSDFSANVSPNGCGTRQPRLDKRTDDGPGEQVLESWSLPAHEAAVRLALRDTSDMLKAAFRSRKAYVKRCKSKLVFGFLPKRWWP